MTKTNIYICPNGIIFKSYAGFKNQVWDTWAIVGLHEDMLSNVTFKLLPYKPRTNKIL